MITYTTHIMHTFITRRYFQHAHFISIVGGVGKIGAYQWSIVMQRQCQPAHLHTQAESGADSWNSSRFPVAASIFPLSHHTPSGQSRVYRATQLRTDGVHCRESAGAGPVIIKQGSSSYRTHFARPNSQARTGTGKYPFSLFS